MVRGKTQINVFWVFIFIQKKVMINLIIEIIEGDLHKKWENNMNKFSLFFVTTIVEFFF